MTDTMKGSCLCGAVSYETNGEPIIVGHCHCVDCRKTSGTGHATHVAMQESMVKLKGALKSHVHPADSGNVVERFFCPTCAAAIHSKNSGKPGMVFLRASSLDDPDQVTPLMIVYASRAPKWDVMDKGLPSFAAMPEGGPSSVMNP